MPDTVSQRVDEGRISNVDEQRPRSNEESDDLNESGRSSVSVNSWVRQREARRSELLTTATKLGRRLADMDKTVTSKGGGARSEKITKPRSNSGDRWRRYSMSAEKTTPPYSSNGQKIGGAYSSSSSTETSANENKNKRRNKKRSKSENNRRRR